MFTDIFYVLLFLTIWELIALNYNMPLLGRGENIFKMPKYVFFFNEYKDKILKQTQLKPIV